MRKLLFILFCIPLVVSAQDMSNVERSEDHHEFDLKIKFKDGSERKVRSEFYENPSKHSMLLVDEKKKEFIYPEQTISVTQMSEPYMTGLSKDSMWLFDVHDGRIMVWSMFPETKLKYADFLSKDGGDLEPYSKKKLIEMMSDSPYGKKEVKTSKALDRWGKIFAVVGLGAIIGGVVNEDLQTPLFTGGVGLLAVSLPLELFAHDKFEHAVDVYNGHYRKMAKK